MEKKRKGKKNGGGKHYQHGSGKDVAYCPAFFLNFGKCLIVSNGFIQCCNVTNSVVPFLPFPRVFCRCYKSGTTTTIVTIFTCFAYVYMFCIRSLVVTPFD